MQFTFECVELLMEIIFTNISFVFIKTNCVPIFFLTHCIITPFSVEKKVQQSNCFKLSIFKDKYKYVIYMLQEKGRKKETKVECRKVRARGRERKREIKRCTFSLC